MSDAQNSTDPAVDDPASEPAYRQLGDEGNPFARPAAKPPAHPEALAEDGAAPDERALDPYEDDELHRSE